MGEIVNQIRGVLRFLENGGGEDRQQSNPESGLHPDIGTLQVPFTELNIALARKHRDNTRDARVVKAWSDHVVQWIWGMRDDEGLKPLEFEQPL